MSNLGAVNDPIEIPSIESAEPLSDATDAPRLRARGSNQVGMRQFNEREIGRASCRVRV